MSIRRRLLNLWLRTVEKRRMRTGSVAQLRRALDLQARLFFHAPRGTKSSWSKYGGIPCLEMTPFATDPSQVLFYIHGGGFVFGSPNTHGAMAANLAQRFGARAVLPRYRLAPEAPFPAAPQDVRAAWDGLLASGVAARNVVIGGDSVSRGNFLAFDHSGAPALCDALVKRGVRIDARGSIIRFGFGMYHSGGDVARLVDLLHEQR